MYGLHVRRDKRKRSLSICQVAVVERWSWRFDRILGGVGSHSSCRNEFLSFPEIRKVCKQLIGGIEEGGAPQAVLAGNRVKLPSVFQLRYFFTKMRLVSGVCVKLLLNILENQLHFTC